MSRSYVERETTPSTTPNVTNAATKSSGFAMLCIVSKVARRRGGVKWCAVQRPAAARAAANRSANKLLTMATSRCMLRSMIEVPGADVQDTPTTAAQVARDAIIQLLRSDDDTPPALAMARRQGAAVLDLIAQVLDQIGGTTSPSTLAAAASWCHRYYADLHDKASSKSTLLGADGGVIAEGVAEPVLRDMQRRATMWGEVVRVMPSIEATSQFENIQTILVRKTIIQLWSQLSACVTGTLVTQLMHGGHPAALVTLADMAGSFSREVAEMARGCK